jgi:hypothetical protein
MAILPIDKQEGITWIDMSQETSTLQRSQDEYEAWIESFGFMTSKINP